MACPHFIPGARLRGGWLTEPRSPLGGLFEGVCVITGDRPAEAELGRLCNFGYARGVCGAFPESSSGPDAFRYSIHASTPSRVELIFIEERACAPAAFRSITYHVESGELDALGDCRAARAQALCRIETHLGRKQTA